MFFGFLTEGLSVFWKKHLVPLMLNTIKWN